MLPKKCFVTPEKLILPPGANHPLLVTLLIDRHPDLNYYLKDNNYIIILTICNSILIVNLFLRH